MISQILPHLVGAKEITHVSVDGIVSEFDGEWIRTSVIDASENIGPEFFKITLSEEIPWRRVIESFALACKKHGARFEMLRAEVGILGITVEAIVQAGLDCWMPLILIDGDWIMFLMPPSAPAQYMPMSGAAR